MSKAKMKITRKELQKGLEYYDPESSVFPAIATRGRKSMTAEELLLVLKWKTGRLKKSYAKTVSRLPEINTAVRIANKRGEEVEAIQDLCKIDEIGVPVASAILTVCYPEKFTILDWRVLDVLEIKPGESSKWSAKDYWKRFVPRVKAERERFDRTLRDTDRALWGLSVYRQVMELIQKT